MATKYDGEAVIGLRSLGFYLTAGNLLLVDSF
jgi:hypothetical protein